MFIRIWKLDSLVVGLIFGIFLLSIRQIVNLLDNKRLMMLLAQSNLELEISKKALEDKHESLKQTSAIIKLEAETDFLTGGLLYQLYNCFLYKRLILVTTKFGEPKFICGCKVF